MNILPVIRGGVGKKMGGKQQAFPPLDIWLLWLSLMPVYFC
jgi:hypothetical protein